MSKRQAASQLGISEGGLRKRLKVDCGVQQLGRFKKVFTVELDNELAEHAKTLEKIFYGLTFKSLRQIAFQFAEANNINHPFSREKQMAGKDWAYSFLERHRLSLRTPSKTSVARMMGFNKVQLDRYFSNLKVLWEKHQFGVSRMFNMDESGLSTVPNKTPKVVSEKGKKLIGKVSSADRGQTVTVVCCMSAAGAYVPPAIIFPRKRRKPELLNGAPPDSLLLTSDSGYINGPLFLEWLEHFTKHVKPSEENPVLLIIDNHSSHLYLDAVLFARNHNIHMLSLPPHSSQKTQPLDRCFFKPLKDKFAEACERYLISNPGKVVTQFQISSLFAEAYQTVGTMGKAINGFKKCGIVPYNPDVFTDEDFLPSTVTDQQSITQENLPQPEDCVLQPSTSQNMLEPSTSNNLLQSLIEFRQSEINDQLPQPQPSTSKVIPEPIPKPSAVTDLQPSISTNADVPATIASEKVRNDKKHVRPSDILPIPKKRTLRQEKVRGKNPK